MNSKNDWQAPHCAEFFTLYAVKPAGGSLEKTIRQDSAFVLLLRISAGKFTWDSYSEFHIIPSKHPSQTAT
jgi:hypothetical protein